jgi:hypothetical protein
MTRSKALVLAAFGAAMGLALAPAYAASTKDCGTATTTNSPSNGWQTSTTTTQTSACNSSSDTGQTTTTTVSNPGGNQPKPKQ